MSADSNIFEAALLRTMTLLASLNVAADLAFGMRERKAGRDPSTDELEEDLLPALREEINTLKALFFQLQSSLALSNAALSDAALSEETEFAGNPGEHQATEPVLRFIDLVRLQKSGTTLHRVHQRLLSLYPAINEETAEAVRRLKNECEAISNIEADIKAPDFSEALAGFS